MKFKIFVCLILSLFVSQVRGDWVRLEPIKKATHQSSKLADILSHTNDPWRDTQNDQVTNGHELTHGINSALRNKYFKDRRTLLNTDKDINGYYLLYNVGYLVTEPTNLTLGKVAQAIPQEYRGIVYDLYMIKQQQHFQNQPCYILDEEVAYTNGTMVGMDLNLMDRAEDSFKRGLELNCYAIYLKRMAKQKDIDKIVDFVTGRNILIYQKLPKKNVDMNKRYKLLLELINER